MALCGADAGLTVSGPFQDGGKNAGTAWKWLIDISAVIFLVLSLVGYILFFSLRHRLVQTMALTVVSLGALVGIFLLFVP